MACVNEAVREDRKKRRQLIPLKGQPGTIEPTADELQAMRDKCTLKYFFLAKG